LDRPFRLYQLSEFSVVGELVQGQGANRMGKTYVALYDENMRRVMMVLFGDSWSGSEKGYFNVYFYPQDSSSGYRSSGYIYTSFRKTAELWWGPFQGGHGAVYATIDGQSDGYPIAECDNASRVIKYVAILGYRHYSYNLVQMRIHDINVVADLKRHDPIAPNPNKPQESDGTHLSNSKTLDNFLDNAQDAASNHLDVFWTGWWPVVHFVVDYAPYPTVMFQIALWVNLLGNWGIDDFAFQLIDESTMSDSEMEALVQSSSEKFAPFFLDLQALTLGVNAAYLLARILAPLAEKGNAFAQLCFAAAVVAFLVLWHMWILEFCHMVIRSAIDRVSAGYMLVGFALSVFRVVAMTFAAAGRLPSLMYRIFGLQKIAKEFTLASYAIFALSLFILLPVLALAATLVFTDLLESIAGDMGEAVGK
ncbi:MAG: hypothetical protein DRO93_13215, partial [Candidatus Thorarchaeota archaeon]